MFVFLISISIIALAAILFVSCASLKTKPILDSQGRITIYHGINVANNAKHSEGHLPWQTKEDLVKLKSWGFNLVRYLVFWEALEPTEGNIDMDYIGKTKERLQWLQELGIDVIIDIHQDVYGPKLTGNGFPEWATNDEGIPFTEQQPWNANYLEPAVIAAYKNFWNSDPWKKRYVEIVQIVFTNFADPFDNVLGVDIMNEPFPIISPDFVKAIKDKKITEVKVKYLKEIANFERNYLDKLYEDVSANVKTQKKFFFEPVIYTSSGIPSRLKFKPGSNWVYYPHYYDPFCHENKPYGEANEKLMEASSIIKVIEASKRFKTPILYGEWGIGQKVGNFEKYITDFCNLADKFNYGWTYYCYDPGHPFSPIDADKKETPQLKALMRPYPQKISGTNPKFSLEGNVFELTYNADSTDKEPTVIFVPGNYYKTMLSDTEQCTFKVETEGHYLNENNYITYYNDISKKKQTIKITW